MHCHLSENFTLVENIKTKVGFERMTATHGATIRHHHAENGHFAEEGSSKHAQPEAKLQTFVVSMPTSKMKQQKETLDTCDVTLTSSFLIP